MFWVLNYVKRFNVKWMSIEHCPLISLSNPLAAVPTRILRSRWWSAKGFGQEYECQGLRERELKPSRRPEWPGPNWHFYFLVKPLCIFWTNDKFYLQGAFLFALYDLEKVMYSWGQFLNVGFHPNNCLLRDQPFGVSCLEKRGGFNAISVQVFYHANGWKMHWMHIFILGLLWEQSYERVGY